MYSSITKFGLGDCTSKLGNPVGCTTLMRSSIIAWAASIHPFIHSVHVYPRITRLLSAAVFFSARLLSTPIGFPKLTEETIRRSHEKRENVKKATAPDS